jgi:type II secretion system protein G
MTPGWLKVMTSQIGKRGFTLIELLVVVSIIIIITGSLLTVIPGFYNKTQKKATKAFMERLEVAIEQYNNDFRCYPPGTGYTGIENLKKALQPIDSTSKKYIEFDEKEIVNNSIVDEWGNPFVYEHSSSAYNTSTYDLYSTGPDGITNSSGNDADDINNWTR